MSADSLHQVGLPQTHTAADEQGGELPSRRLGHSQGCRTGLIDEAYSLYRP